MRAGGLGLIGSLALAAPALAEPGEMNAATFLAKAEALQAKGIAAMFSPDLKLVMAEGNAAGMRYRARLAEERRAGHPSSCPPDKPRVSSTDMFAQLRSYPAAQRPAIGMTQVFADMFRKKWPCR